MLACIVQGQSFFIIFLQHDLCNGVDWIDVPTGQIRFSFGAQIGAVWCFVRIYGNQNAGESCFPLTLNLFGVIGIFPLEGIPLVCVESTPGIEAVGIRKMRGKDDARSEARLAVGKMEPAGIL